MAQFHSTIDLGDAASYRRGVRIARDVLLYARQRKDVIAASAGGGDAAARVQRALAAEPDDNLLLGVTDGRPGEAPLRLVVRRTDLYVISIHNGQAGFYFTDTRERQRWHEVQVGLRFSSSYVDLGAYASLAALDGNALRAAVTGVAAWRADRTISTVTMTARGPAQTAEMRQLLLLILATAEAFRLRPVEDSVAQALGEAGAPALGLGEIDLLVRDWSKRSRAAAASGVMDPAIGVPALP